MYVYSSKCGKKWTRLRTKTWNTRGLTDVPSIHFLTFPWSIAEQTHGNIEFFVSYNKEKIVIITSHASVLQLIITKKNPSKCENNLINLWKLLDCNVNIQSPQFDFQITCSLLSAVSLSLISALDRLQFAYRQVYDWIFVNLIAIVLLMIFQICTIV